MNIDMDENNITDTTSLFDHWMTELTTSQRYHDLDATEIQKIQHNSKAFLSFCLNSTAHLSKIDPGAIRPLFEFLRNIRKTHEQQGLSIRDTTLLALSLKSSLTEYIKSHENNPHAFKDLNYLLDMFGIMAFELYSNEQETVIGQQAEQIKYLQHATGRAFGALIGQSNAMKGVYQAIGLVLENDVTVLLQGESGTGKDVIANVIHTHSSRKNHPFVPVNCGAIPDNLIESELFGHEKGAFTGADTQRAGIFELANNGTVFLDEISELTLDQQTRLLRVLQNQQIQRVGGSDMIPINVRVIAASNQPLETLVASKQFRLDLFYRINVFPIHIPRLVDRENDVILLANHFIEKHVKRLGLSLLPKLTPSAHQFLMVQPWPGNIRELENMIQRALILSHGNDINDAMLRYMPGQPSPLVALPSPTSTPAVI
ncbi:MAG: sigma-54 interaction domain-containing protein [Candidatus Marinamargulisbacteria bacterium]